MGLFDKRQIDSVRAKGFGVLSKLGGGVGERLRSLNETLGSPLASEQELADRRAFESGIPPQTKTDAAEKASATPVRASGAPTLTAPAPVIVYHMDKQRRDVAPIVQILDEQGVAHTVLNIEGDPAAQTATRRDSKGFRLPVVFIAGEAIGGKIELINAIATGDLKVRVFGK
jgi:glutaredoxin